MKISRFNEAMQIICEHHTNEVIINNVKSGGYVGDCVSGNPTIHLVSCVPSVINKLIVAGFTLSLEKGLLEVYKIGE